MVQLVSTGEVVGTVDLIEFTPLHGRAEVGIAILEDYRRRGYAHEELGLLCKYAFTQLHMHQLYAYVAADNEASLALFEACGFCRKVVLEQWLRCEDCYKDVCLLQNLSTFSV